MNTTNAETTKKTFSAKEFFAQWQEILTQLIYSTFGSVSKPQSKERMEKFAMDVEAAATSLCVEKGIPTAEREQTEQQLRSSSGLLVPILLTVFFAGQDPPVANNMEAFVEENFPISLVGSDGGDIPKLVQCCNSYLDSGTCFLRAGDCQGEAYLLPGGGVFKPSVMEKPTTLLRHGFEGSEHLREIAAFRIDQAYGGFARVPPTAPVTVFADSLPDRDEGPGDILSGSLQKWVNSACSSEDMGSSRFNLNDIHHIAILDLLLYNTDRHGGNLLVEKSSSLTCGASCGKGNSRLVPIDHGLCLPDFRHLDQAMFDWHFWRQADQPLSKKDLELIASFNGDKVAGILRGLGLPSGAVLTARIMVAVLQQTALKRAWTLRQIATFSSTDFKADSSALAEVVAATAIAADAQTRDIPFAEHAAFVDLFNKKLGEHLDKKESITVITV